MPKARAAILDCGANHVAFAQFVRARGARLCLEHFVREGFTVEPGREEEWLAQVRTALAALRTRVKSVAPVTVVLPGHLVLTKFTKTPRVDPAKREKIIGFEAQQNIPYALEDVVWGHAVSGEGELDVDVMLCAAKLDAVDALCGVLESTGFSPRSLLPPAVALEAAARHALPVPGSTPALLVEVGARSTTLLLKEPHRYHARTLAIGGQAVTQQIAANQDCDFADAEALKLSPRHADLVAPAIEGFATRLAQEITRSVLHFKRQTGAASPGRVLLTGGAARPAGLRELLAARLHVPVEGADMLGTVEILKPAADGGVAAHAESSAALVGAAALEFAAGRPALDLLPPRLRSREDTRRRRPWLAAAAAVAALALLPPLAHHRSLNAELRAKSDALAAEIAPLREREARNRANAERLAALQQQIAVLHDVHARRANWQALFADLQERLVRVEDVWLERLHIAPAAAGGGPLRIAISGRMLDKTNPLANVSPDIYRRVTTLLARMADSPFVSAIENERFDNRQPGILHFDFVLVAEPGRPL